MNEWKYTHIMRSYALPIGTQHFIKIFTEHLNYLRYQLGPTEALAGTINNPQILQRSFEELMVLQFKTFPSSTKEWHLGFQVLKGA